MKRFRDFIQLNEGVKNKYWPMLEGLYNIQTSLIENERDKQEYKELYQKVITETVSVFKRPDRVVWALKWYRFIEIQRIINRLEDTLGWEDVDGYYEKRKQAYNLANKFYNKIKQQYVQNGTTPIELKDSIMEYGFDQYDNFLRTFEHMFSLPIPEIQNYRFDWKAPSTALEDLREYEEVWKKERKGTVQADDGDEPIINFGDGFVWFNLHKAYCPAEADAMGHCGNQPRSHSSDTILSLRKLVSKEENLYRSHLTFILNEHGYLTEMKGRGNDKPAEKYHPYIIELLKHPIVNGMIGGGYLPESNFSMYDLPENVKIELQEMKPGLKGPVQLIRDMFKRDPGAAADELEKLLTDHGIVFRNMLLVDANTMQLGEFRDLGAIANAANDSILENLILALEEFDIAINNISSEDLNVDLKLLQDDIVPVIEKLMFPAKERLFDYFGIEWHRKDPNESDKIAKIVRLILEGQGGIFEDIIGRTYLAASLLSIAETSPIDISNIATEDERFIDMLTYNPLYFMKLIRNYISDIIDEYIEADWPLVGGARLDQEGSDDPISSSWSVLIDTEILLDGLEAYMIDDFDDFNLYHIQELQEASGPVDNLIDQEALRETRRDHGLDEEDFNFDFSQFFQYGRKLAIFPEAITIDYSQMAAIMQDMIMHNIKEDFETKFLNNMLFEEDILRGLT